MVGLNGKLAWDLLFSFFRRLWKQTNLIKNHKIKLETQKRYTKLNLLKILKPSHL